MLANNLFCEIAWLSSKKIWPLFSSSAKLSWNTWVKNVNFLYRPNLWRNCVCLTCILFDNLLHGVIQQFKRKFLVENRNKKDSTNWRRSGSDNWAEKKIKTLFHLLTNCHLQLTQQQRHKLIKKVYLIFSSKKCSIKKIKLSVVFLYKLRND